MSYWVGHHINSVGHVLIRYRFQVFTNKYVKINYPACDLRSYSWFFSKIIQRHKKKHLLNTFGKTYPYLSTLAVLMVISRSPGFHFLSPGFWAKTIFRCFFKTITQITFIFFIYYMPWNEVTLDNFLSFYLFSSHPYLYLYAAFGKKHFVLRAQHSRSGVLLRTHDML